MVQGPRLLSSQGHTMFGSLENFFFQPIDSERVSGEDKVSTSAHIPFARTGHKAPPCCRSQLGRHILPTTHLKKGKLESRKDSKPCWPQMSFQISVVVYERFIS